MVYRNQVRAIRGIDGSPLWTFTAPGTSALGRTWDPIVADLDGDGRPEVLVNSDDGHIYALQGESVEGRGDVRITLRGGYHDGVYDLVVAVHLVALRGKEPMPRQHLPKDHTQRIQIRPRVDLFVKGLLWRHIGQLA